MRESEQERQWLDRWQRRGELLTIASLAGLATWLTGVVPTAKTSHANIWPPIGIFAFLAVIGIYVMIAPDMGWPLPGKRRLKARLAIQGFEDAVAKNAPLYDKMEQDKQRERWEQQREQLVDAATRLVDAIEKFAERGEGKP